MVTTQKSFRESHTFRLGLMSAAILAATTAGLRPAWADDYEGISIKSTAGAQAAGFASDYNVEQNHAIVFLANGTLVDLNPAGYPGSQANGTNGTQQVGIAVDPISVKLHAVLWSGSAGSLVDLNPATGFEIESEAFGISPDGTQQVGFGDGSATRFRGHALLWSGTANSAVDLNPAGIENSVAYGTDGTRQVGNGSANGAADDTGSRAFLWTGTAASAVNLQPTNLTGFVNSFAYGVSGTQQVGYGTYTVDGYSHALLWTGSADSAVDLNPPADQHNNSIAYSTNGAKQVGYEDFGVATRHAMVWSGTADSEIDLNALLPADGQWTSIAYDIDASGNIFGWANGTLNGVIGDYAIEWSPTTVSPIGPAVASPSDDPAYTATVLYQLAVPAPEPATLPIFAATGAALLVRRRRQSHAAHSGTSSH